MDLIKEIEKLSSFGCVSGREKKIADYIISRFDELGYRAYTDALGNVIAEKKSENVNAKKLMIDAHMDEIGLMVTEVDEKGFLKFTNIGGIDERILPGSEVVVHAREDIGGIIGIKPPHIQTDGENKKTIPIKELAINLAMDADEVKELVKPGDSVTFSGKAGKMANGYIFSKALDDRAAVAAVFASAQMLGGKNLDIDVCFVISVQEEVGLRGAKTAAYCIDADFALVCDVTHAITADNTKYAFEAGRGCAYSIGPNVSKKLTDVLLECAKRENIYLSPEVSGGSTGTNAWAVQVSREGVLTAVLSVPLRYMHTPTEVVCISDIQDAARLMAGFACSLSERSDEFDGGVIK